jgi:rRNA maturation endonuclease Nob1
LQAKLDDPESNNDNEQLKRTQRQLDGAINLAISFRDRHAKLQAAGEKEFEIQQNVRILADKVQSDIVSGDASLSDICGSCSAILETDLDFCPACGAKK